MKYSRKEASKIVRKRDRFQCQICGEDESLEAAHIAHAGMGGSPEGHDPDNMIALCTDHHKKLNQGQIFIERWNPDDKENGLIVMDAQSKRIPNEKLYFYQIPTKELATRWLEVQQEMEAHLSNVIHSLWDAVRCLKRMKEEKVDGQPLWRGSGAKTWREYYNQFVKAKWDKKALGTANRYISAYSALEPLVEESEWSQIRPGNAVEISGVVKKASPEKSRDFIELSKGRREDLEKELRDWKIKKNQAERVPDCKDCEKTEKIDEIEGLKLGKKGLTKCPISGYILESMDRDDSRDVAEEFHQRRGCFQPKD